MKRVAVYVSSHRGGIKVDWSVRRRPSPPRGSMPLCKAQANANGGPAAATSPVRRLAQAESAARLRFDWHLLSVRPTRLWVRGVPDDALPAKVRTVRDAAPANIATRAPGVPSVHDRIRMVFDSTQRSAGAACPDRA